MEKFLLWKWSRRFSIGLGHLPAALALIALAPAPVRAAVRSESARYVTINDVLLEDAQVQTLEARYGVRVADGRYWYDSASGAWGVQGGPTLGFVLPGLELGGPLRSDASSGNTGVFINGRELHWQDVAALQQLGPVMPGRYWVDAYGNCGYEGGPAFVNLAVLARQKAQQSGSWGSSSKDSSTHVGGDGQGFTYFMSKDSSGNITSYSSGP